MHVCQFISVCVSVCVKVWPHIPLWVKNWECCIFMALRVEYHFLPFMELSFRRALSVMDCCINKITLMSNAWWMHMDYMEMIMANKADTCVRYPSKYVSKYVSAYVCGIVCACVKCVCACVDVVTVRVQALSALPARLGSKQCLFRSSCLREMAVCACTNTHTHSERWRGRLGKKRETD